MVYQKLSFVFSSLVLQSSCTKHHDTLKPTCQCACSSIQTASRLDQGGVKSALNNPVDKGRRKKGSLTKFEQTNGQNN